MNKNVVDTVSKGKYIAVILPEDEPGDSPREWDNLGTMVCFHRRYNLGDKNHGYDDGDFSSWAELKAEIIRRENPAAILPIRMYDHSGISISVSGGYPYNDPWDSGMIGFIFISKEKVRAEYSCKRISKKLLAKVTDYLKGEVRTYDDYLTGNVFGYQLFKIDNDEFDPNEGDDPEDFGEEIDSCWGYYGLEDFKKELASMIDGYIKDDEESAWKSLPIRESCLE